MKTIWKYALAGPGLDTPLEIPKGAKILDCQIQGRTICMWCIVDEGREKEKRSFTVIGTGWEVPSHTTFLATAQSPPYVWHVFEIK